MCPSLTFLCVFGCPFPMTHGSASALCQEYLWEASHYLVKQVFNGIKEMFSATRDIQVRSLLSFTSTFTSTLVHS